MAPRRSWIHLTRTPSLSLVAGVLWLVLASGQWWLLAGDARPLRAVLAGLSSVLAVWYLPAGAVRVRRAEPLRAAPGGATSWWNL